MKDTKKKKGYRHVIITVAAALLAAAAVFLLTISNAFSALDYMVTDRLYQVPRGVSGQIKIIGIDEKTLEEYGPINTWSRSRYAELIKILTENEEYEPSVIGLDIHFSGHVDEEGNAALSEAAEEYGRIITVGQFYYEDMMQRDENGNGYHPVKDFYLPYEELKAVAEVSFSNVSQDSDGTVRRITMETEYKGTKYNSFPYAV